MDRLIKSAADLRYLLAKGYPRSAALTFVGNHYQLTRTERDFLNRGVYPDSVARARREKMVRPEQTAGRSLGVDGYNVLITMESALLGRDLIEADDGLIRDIAGLYASYRPSEVTTQALNFILDFLKHIKPDTVLFLLDAPMSHSGEFARRITSVLADLGLSGQAKAVSAPEKELSRFPGLVATSDSVLIDRTPEPFDLAGHLIKKYLPGAKIITLTQPCDRIDRGNTG